MKVFLSHPMHGLSEKEIDDIRNNAKANLIAQYPNETIEIIDNYHHDGALPNSGRLWHLGESIKQMEEADLICFCKGWQKARGCRIERVVAALYELPVIHETKMS